MTDEDISAKNKRGKPPSREQLSSRERKAILLRLSPEVHAALAKWAADDLRSVNAQIEVLLRRALQESGRSPKQVSAIRRPGRPQKQ